MMRRLVVLSLVLLALPVRAGLFDDDEARARVDKLKAELQAEVEGLAARVDTAAKNQLDFANQVETIKADLARLRGQVEVLANEVEATQKRQRDFYVDLDSRLRKLEEARQPAAEAAAETPKVDPAQEGKDYEAALAAFKAGKYKDALAAFQGFIKAYGSSGLLPNAYFWAASSQYQLKEFAKAAELFAKVVATWPNDAKAPAALMAQANAQLEAGDAKGSRKTLERVVKDYPATPEGQSAKQRLKK